MHTYAILCGCAGNWRFLARAREVRKNAEQIADLPNRMSGRHVAENLSDDPAPAPSGLAVCVDSSFRPVAALCARCASVVVCLTSRGARRADRCGGSGPVGAMRAGRRQRQDATTKPSRKPLNAHDPRRLAAQVEQAVPSRADRTGRAAPHKSSSTPRMPNKRLSPGGSVSATSTATKRGPLGYVVRRMASYQMHPSKW